MINCANCGRRIEEDVAMWEEDGPLCAVCFDLPPIHDSE